MYSLLVLLIRPTEEFAALQDWNTKSLPAPAEQTPAAEKPEPVLQKA